MKLLVLFSLVAVCATGTHGSSAKLELFNNNPCAYVKRIVIRELNGDAAVDVIQYATSTEAKSIYFYRGPGLWDLWKTKLPELPAEATFDATRETPAAGEIGSVELVGELLHFLPLKSARMRRNFSKADELVAAYRAAGEQITPEFKAKYRDWMVKRFSRDIVPDPRILCADQCGCGQFGRAYLMR